MKRCRSAQLVSVLAALLCAACTHDYDEFQVGAGATGGAGGDGTGGTVTMSGGAPASGGQGGGPASGGADGSGASPATGGAPAAGGMAGAGGGGECVPPAVNCSGVCSTLSADPQHCGSCANSCPIGFECTASLCGCAGTGTCGGGRDRVCNTTTRLCECTGDICKRGETCTGGQTAQCSCNGGAPCTGANEVCCGSASCKELQTDPQNCGACGNVCVSGTCNAGQCG